MDNLSEFFHRVVDMLPWRQESDKQDAHVAVEDVVVPAFGRNATPAGVVTSDEPASAGTGSNGPESFPTGTPSTTGSDATPTTGD